MKKVLMIVAMSAAALWAPLAQAQAGGSVAGPYVVASVGQTQYDYDCYFFAACDKARATLVKLGGGYRFGVFALEGWASDFGHAGLPWQNSLRLRAVGVSGAWMLNFSPTLHGLLRAGGARVEQRRTDDANSSGLEGTFGLALLVDVAPSVAVEVAYDLTTSTGKNSGSVLAQGLTAGLRLRF